MTMERIHYRRFNQHQEDPERIFSLFEKVYGDSAAIRRRWEWEFLRHPCHEDVRIYSAEYSGTIIGLTVRMPSTLWVDGQIKRAYFATNSMVLPEFRGQGVIRSLYHLASQNGDVQLSKGTAPGMYAVLQKIGYREIVPNTFQTCLLAPLKWVVSKMFRKARFKTNENFCDMQHGEFYPLNGFSGEHEVLTEPANTGFLGGVAKDIRTLNWRYFEIPHRKYHVFVRKCGTEIVSMLVLRLDGLAAYLVDILWAERAQDEPKTSIQFAKSAAVKMGAVKLMCWGTYEGLRSELRKQSFFERSDSPRFSYYSADEYFHGVNWTGFHFVHGDGDMDYL